MNFIAIIPARFASSRLPGKPLVDINGKPMVIRVMERVQASGADRVIVATDHQMVVDAVKRAKGEVCLTRFDHNSGTERIQEVIARNKFHDDQIIVNVQGDEPLIPPPIVRQVANSLLTKKEKVSITSLAVPITTTDEAFNPNIVKVVVDAYGYALYFSRATIPWSREGFNFSDKQLSNTLMRHIGIYAYRVEFIRRYARWSASPLEKIENLEQLRVLWYGEKIHIALANVVPFMGVDTKEDLVQVRLLQQQID